MTNLPTGFETCHPRPEILAGDLPDAIIALTRAESRAEVLSRSGKTTFGPALEADVVKVEGGTHAELGAQGWPVLTSAAAKKLLTCNAGGGRKTP